MQPIIKLKNTILKSEILVGGSVMMYFVRLTSLFSLDGEGLQLYYNDVSVGLCTGADYCGRSAR